MQRHPKTRRGFTLVELLVVVLILAILMAVALPLYLNAIQNSERGTARANMQTIANAEQSYKLQSANHDYLAITKDADFANLKDLSSPITGPGLGDDKKARSYTVTPVDADTACPNDDKTTAPKGSFYVQTTAKGDGCFVPGVSSQ